MKRTISPAIHGRNIELVHREYRNEPWAIAVRDVLDLARAETERFHGIVEMIEADRTLTLDARRVLTATAAERTLSPLLPKLDAVDARLNEARDSANLRIRDSLKAGREAGGYPSEIRATIRAASPKDRNAIISRAVESGNGRVIGALLSASSEAFMTGLTPAGLDALRKRWIQARLPEEAGRLEAVEKARGALRRGGEALLTLYGRARAAAQDATEKVKARKEALGA